MKHFLFCIFFSLMSHLYGSLGHYDLAICAIFRDEAPYLKEWIEFHKLVGVQHFYLFNHRSEDNYKEVLSPYIKKGVLSLYDTKKYQNSETEQAEDFNTLQCQVYLDAAKALAGKVKWVIFLDIDEFIYPVNENSLREMLKEYDDCVGVAANWQMFGTSFVKNIPKDKLLIETLTRCAVKDYPPNMHVKSIVKPKYVVAFHDPHAPKYVKHHPQVNSDKVPFTGPFSPYVQVDKLRINHYWTRDEDYFWKIKVPRRQKWGMPIEGILKGGTEEMNETTDTSIQKYVKKLRKAVFQDH